MEIKICIGIVSYLPDDDLLRRVRIERFLNLLSQLEDHFNLPIIVISQNWGDFTVKSNNVTLFHYKKLGITGARRVLREKFIDSCYDYMIMLDDDMELSDKQKDYDDYIHNITKNKKDYYYVENFLNNFSVISKEAFKSIDYDSNINAEDGTGYEDWIFHEKCKKKFNSMSLTSSLPKYKRSHFLNDKYSTWNNCSKDIINSNELVSRKLVRNITQRVIR